MDLYLQWIPEPVIKKHQELSNSTKICFIHTNVIYRITDFQDQFTIIVSVKLHVFAVHYGQTTTFCTFGAKNIFYQTVNLKHSPHRNMWVL